MPTSETKPNCPQCELNDQVVKVSHLYILARERKQPTHPYAPPAGKNQTTRPIHPDVVVGVLSIGAVFILINIINTQPTMILPSLVTLVAFYVFYFFMRKKILARFQAEKDQENAYKGDIEAAVGEWMKLYYCGRDKGVFHPQDPDAGLIPLEQMRAYLMRKK